MGLEREIREKIVLEQDTEVYMMSERRKVDWRDLGGLKKTDW